MDTDGHCMKSKKGNFTGTEYSTVSEQLADDVAEIVHSIGGIVRKKSRIPTYHYKGEKKEGKRVYRLNIKFSNDINPFRLKRKSGEYLQPNKYKVGRYIKDIKLEKQGESVCIQVGAEDHLYVTEHGIVTHNTYQSIVAALEIESERILVVCPSSLKINWKREIENFCEDVSIIKGKHWDPDRFTIINYDILKNFHTIEERGKKYEDWELRREIVEFNPDLIILDEAHYVKNHKSIRGKILKDISKRFKTERVWLLTGTPIANRPMDYFNLLSIIDSPVTNNWVHYAKTYCDGMRFRKGNKFIWVTTGASNLEELSIKTRRTILRRKKEDVLDLPEKLITPVYLELENVDGYKNVWNEYMEQRKLDGKKGNPAKDLVEMTLLRTFIAMETVPYTIEKTEEALELGKKTIIFCNFNDEMDSFINHFGDKCVCVRGGMTDKQKQRSVDRFQEDDSCVVFVGQIKAAGVGLTLTAAEIVIMNSLDWVPGNHEQAEDRAYRIGQKETDNIYYMLIDDTIDTLVWNILNEKKKVIGTIMGETDIITEFLNKIDNGN
jgi:SWI/SNF-related matrix-associated actin-dependent regulator 1 of chromatin subfamily A